MRVAVLGASGGTGRHIVSGAFDRGLDVVAVGRSTTTLASELPEANGRLDVRRADLLEEGSVPGAIRGCDAVICSIAPPLQQHLLRSTVLFSRGVRSLVSAMRAERVPRLVVVSSAGVLDGDPSHPPVYRYVLKPLLFDRAMYRDMRVMEQTVRDSGLEWIIVRAAGLTDGPRSGRARVQDGRLPEGGSRVSRLDLAWFLLDQLQDDTHLSGHPTLAY